MTDFLHGPELREKCGVFGAYGVDSVAYPAMQALVALNHRGQEGAGLVTSDGTDFHYKGNGGLVREILTAEVLHEMRGNRALGHTRYGTSGGLGGVHIQPTRSFDELDMYFAENANQCDVSPLRKFLEEHGQTHEGLNDSEMKAKVLGTLMLEGATTEQAIEEAFPLFTGAFASIILDKDALYAIRDKCGIRPLVLGKKGAGYIVASETCAIEASGGEVVREIKPGELIKISREGIESKQLAEPDRKEDIFERIYFAREDSFDPETRRTNFSTRYAMGEYLFDENPEDANIADIVVPVPNSAIPSALGYANASGLPYVPALHKNPYIHRTFIEPTEEMRAAARAMKLSAMREHVEGKRVIVVDDSIVRGGTQKDVVELLFKAGAAEVHVRITSPPIMYPDFYGVNTPKQSGLAYVKYKGIEGVREAINATTLRYLSLESTVRATGRPVNEFSLSAFNGEYPISIGELEKELIKF